MLFKFLFLAMSSLTLDDAMQIAVDDSPTLLASRYQIGMRVGERVQSRAYPNPFFAYSVENVFGNKRWKGWDSAEQRYEFTQPVILGNKREHRMRAACYEHAASIAEYRALEESLFNSLKKTFLEVVARQELLQLAEEQKSVAAEVLNVIGAKVDAGKASLIGRNRAQIAKINAELAYTRAQSALETARGELAYLLGSACPKFCTAVYEFYAINCPPCFDDVENHPDFLKSRYNYSAGLERLASEKAERIPDVDVVMGVKTENKFNERGMILGLAFPIPVFDCNGGNIRKSANEVEKLNALVDDVELRLNAKLRITRKEALKSYEEVMRMKSDVLSLAEEAFSLAKQGYEEGKFDYLELLDAKHTLFDVKERYIESLLELHKNNADIEYLTI